MARTASRSMFSDFYIWIAIGLWGAYMLVPLRETLRFGIDLVGGTYLTLEVQTDKAVEADLVSKLQAIDDIARDAGVKKPKNKSIENKTLIVVFDSLQDAQIIASGLKQKWTNAIVSVDRTNVVVILSDVSKKKIEEDAVESNIEVLRSRLNPMGIGEIPISRQGEKNIVIELPDIDPLEAKERIGRAAQLEFRLVHKTAPTENDLLFDLDGIVPADREILSGVEQGRKEFYLVDKYATVTGKDLSNVRPAFGGKTGMQPVVQFEFSALGGDKFYDLTSKNYGRLLAIVLDGDVISAPSINSAIRSNGEITGNFTAESARTLALLLKSGAFVAPVTFEEERQIGPSLGQESIEKGLISCLASLGILFVFAVVYYKLSGIFAFLALLYNLLLILMGLSWLGATLTLPGIAGMILTVGMAIDAAILIYEQIKDQLARGLTPNMAVTHGFSDAMTVILDANITTFIVGVVLYHFGTGPIQGFAVTLMLGIVSTLISTLFFLKSVFKLYLRTVSVEKLSI